VIRGWSCYGRIALAGVAASLSVLVGPAFGSRLIDRNATDVSLQLNAKGEALLSYRAHGQERHVLVWGAVNASPPQSDIPQVSFQLDYSGGFAKYFRDNPQARQLASEYRRIKGTPGYLGSPVVRELQQLQQAADLYWQTAFHGGCGSYTGPPIAWALITCTAPDGSYWAVQAWQRDLPDYGVSPTPTDAAWELRLSHWTGELPLLTVHTDWAWQRWDHLFGTLTYAGRPVFGFHSTSDGDPLDAYGRNIYIDTFDSAYGAGWRRENSALTHNPTGAFCYSVNPHPGHAAGAGTRYRITVVGPGVTPDEVWEGPAPGPYKASADGAANRQIAALHDRLCRPN
jgi:hypothetical protein